MAQDDRSDGQLLVIAQTDPEAFGVFYDRHVKLLLGFFYRRTASAELAADLTAETFAAAWQARGRYRDTGAPAVAWLLGIARRELAHTFRRGRAADRARRRLGLPRMEVDDQSLERIEELADFAPMRAAIRDAMHGLSPKLAAAVQLRVAQELPYAEVARRLGCTEQAARARTARALTQLASALKEYA